MVDYASPAVRAFVAVQLFDWSRTHRVRTGWEDTELRLPFGTFRTLVLQLRAPVESEYRKIQARLVRAPASAYDLWCREEMPDPPDAGT